MMRNTCFALFLGNAWYSVEARYSTATVPVNTIAPTIPTAPPRRAAAWTRSGVTATAARKPTPWLTLFATSSPREGARLRASSRRTEGVMVGVMTLPHLRTKQPPGERANDGAGQNGRADR